MSIYNGIILKKNIYNGQKVKKWNHNGVRVFTAGSTVTYYVDSGVSYIEEVDSEASCLSPKTFTPTKSGWTFVGWREDTTASSSVLSSKVMGDSPIVLYAVFKKAVTVTYYNNSTTASSTSGCRYYNNGNVVNPSFTLTQASKSHWIAVGWSTSNIGNGDITYKTYNNSATFTRSTNVTLYGRYNQVIKVTYYNDSTSPYTTMGTRCYNSSGNVFDPPFALTQASKSGWTAVGWSTSTAGNGDIIYNNGTEFTRNSNVTLYGRYNQTITVTYYNGSTSASTTSGTRCYNSSGNVVNPSFTLTQVALSGWTARGWSTGTAGNSNIYVNNANSFTRDSNITLYGMYMQSITVAYYNGSANLNTTSGTRYYNSNGNIVNPSFTLTQAAISGWAARGWSTSTAGNGGISYNNGVTFTRDSSITLYGMYYQTISLSYNGNSATSGGVSTQSDNRYYNSGSGNVVNPSFSIAANGFARTNYSFIAWALGSTGGAQYGAGAIITLDTSNTLFAVWSKNAAVLLNTGDNMSNPVYLWSIPMDLEGAQTAPGCYPAASTSIDCTDYNYCKVRVYAQDCGAEPSGNSQNNYNIYLGFTTTYSGATHIAHKTAGSSVGTYGEGTAYDKWADIVINVSALSGAQRLHCIGHKDCPGGSGYFNVWISKITMYN